jgi:amylosucrase
MQSAQYSTASILEHPSYRLKAKDKAFAAKLAAHIPTILSLYRQLYGHHPQFELLFGRLVETIVQAYHDRSSELRKRDSGKEEHWFLSNKLTGMSLYVDRFAGDLQGMHARLPYLQDLGVNFLHLMPLFQSPAGESDGGYAVSDFRKVDEKFGTLEDLESLRKSMHQKDMYLMLDIVLNHTSHRHEWAEKAKAGDVIYQDYFYMYPDRWIPNQYETHMPEIFPEAAPGNFTYVEECGKWVMTVFHNYQWDLNYMNPAVFRDMLDNVFFYANLGVDLLRIDAPAFIWKQTGTTSQNLPEVHTLLQLIKQCVQVATPGMALLGEAIVAPKEIIKYFGTGEFTAKECDFAYNATQMALQWDMLASGDTHIMLAAQHDILQKPFGTSWISYTRCHDDIGLGYEDAVIAATGKEPYAHRKFLMEYYSGKFEHTPARGALFSFNPKTGDARISGTLAALCGLEKAIYEQDEFNIRHSIQKIIMMQAYSFFIGGLPMLYYGDEVGYTNDYSFYQDPSKSYDNRWLNRPKMDWAKNALAEQEGTIEHRIFTQVKKLIQIRSSLDLLGDYSNLTWLTPHNRQVAAYMREYMGKRFYGVFNFGAQPADLTWYAFREKGEEAKNLIDQWSGHTFQLGLDHEHLHLEPYGFYLFVPE